MAACMDCGNAEAEAELRRALDPHGRIESLRWDDDDSSWRVCFASHEAAEAAQSATLEGADAVFCAYNGRPHGERGWTSFESGVATEALSRAAFFPRLHAALKPLPPKLYEIDGDEPEPLIEMVVGDEGAGPRIERVRASIKAAFFTGKADKPMVVRLYNDYITSIANAMNRSGEGQKFTYEGERNAAARLRRRRRRWRKRLCGWRSWWRRSQWRQRRRAEEGAVG